MVKTSLGIEENLEGAMCYIFFWVSGLIFYFVEDKNKFIRFHAMQSIMLFLPLTVFAIVFSWLLFIPFLGWLFGMLIWIAAFILWVVLMLKALQGEKFKLPLIGDLAEQNS